MLLILTGTPTGSLELAGDARATFEPAPGPDGYTLLALSDGTLLAWHIDAGRCHIRTLARGTSALEHDPADSDEQDDQDDQDVLDGRGEDPSGAEAPTSGFASDLVTLEGPLRWVVHAGMATSLRALLHRRAA